MTGLRILPLTKPIKTAVDIPGSKSYTNQALILATLTTGPVTLHNPLYSDDTETMLDCLTTLGLDIDRRPESLTVNNDITSIKDRKYELNVNVSGTAARFLLALSAIIPGRQILAGQPALHKRPIGRLVTALRKLGADIEYLDKDGYPPLRVNSSSLSGDKLSIDGGESSQYLSALLMIAPFIGEMTIQVKRGLISKPYAAMTIEAMQAFGVMVDSGDNRYHIPHGSTYSNTRYAVEADISSACYFAALAALTGSTITLRNVNPASRQADMGFLKILEKMGNQVDYGPEAITVTGKGVKPLRVTMQDCPDQAQTLAVLAAFAHGKTVISGIQSLRLKETERIIALQAELQKMNIVTTASKSSLTIHGGQPGPTAVATYGDHRMAMSFAIAGARLDGMIIENPDVVTKTFPDFWKQLTAAGVSRRPRRPNIVLIGLRGSGKTTIATALARALKREHLDLDDIMSENLSMDTSQIVTAHGWQHFRKQEAAIAQQLSYTEDKIISTGGGIVLHSPNIAVLKHSGPLVWLRASIPVLTARLSNSYHRPTLTQADNLHDELSQLAIDRRPLYETAADVIVDTDDLTPDEVAKKIINQLKLKELAS